MTMPDIMVRHGQFGLGKVVRVQGGGLWRQVEFSDGLPRWVRFDEVEEASAPASGSSTSTFPPATPSLPAVPTTPTVLESRLSSDAFRFRRMIEAFRMGVVPYDCGDEFTVGRQDETKRLAAWLTGQQCNTLVLVGDYGAGKTHLVQFAYGQALQAGFAVAHVDLHAMEVPLHRPKLVYSRLVWSFRWRPSQQQQIQHFRDFLNEALVKGALKDHPYFGCLSGNTADDNLWDWIEAREPYSRPVDSYLRSYRSLPPMYNYSKAANLYCNLLSALGWVAREVLHLPGLVLFFDEAEVANQAQHFYQAAGSLNFVKALVHTANGDEQLLGEPWKNGLGLDYHFGKVPFLFRQPSGLKLLIAFTPIDAAKQVCELPATQRLDIDSLTDADLKLAFDRICSLYADAYGFSGLDSLLDADLRATFDRYGSLLATASGVSKKMTNDEVLFQLVKAGGGRTRRFMKGSVEILDLARLASGRKRDVRL